MNPVRNFAFKMTFGGELKNMPQSPKIFNGVKKIISILILIVPLVILTGLGPPLRCTRLRDAGVFKSEDSGQNWQQKVKIDKKHSIASVNILSIAINPKDANIIYLGTEGNALYKSKDKGETWQEVADQGELLAKRADIYDIALDSKNPDILYIASYQDFKGRLLKSVDGGKVWEETYLVSQDEYLVGAVAVDAYQPQTVYIGTSQGGVLQSMDYGKTWKVLRWFEAKINKIVIDPNNTQKIFVSTEKNGIFRTEDKGMTWKSLEEVLGYFPGAMSVRALVMDPKDSNILYSGSKYGIIKTHDGGNTWESVDIIIPPEDLPVTSIAVDPLRDKVLYVGAGSNIYKTEDDGVNWQVKGIGTTRTIKVIAIDPNNSNNIYVGVSK